MSDIYHQHACEAGYYKAQAEIMQWAIRDVVAHSEIPDPRLEALADLDMSQEMEKVIARCARDT